MNLKKYFLIWLRTSGLSLESVLTSRGASLMYLGGKFVRFFFFLWLILKIGTQVDWVSGYTIDHLVTVFLVFNLVDTGSQFLFRGIYWFRRDVTHGELDFKLIKPVSPLFQALTSRTDMLDLPLLMVTITALLYRSFNLLLENWVWVGLMIVASGILSLSIHILAAALCILTTEVDHTIMIYRDLSAMARIPIDAYIKPVRVFLTFVVPIAVIMTFPAKALLGILSWQGLVFGLLAACALFFISLKLWRYALKSYSSASS